MERRVFNRDEAAQYLGVSVSALEKYVSLHLLSVVRYPSTKTGLESQRAAVRFDRNALDRFIDKNCEAVVDPEEVLRLIR